MTAYERPVPADGPDTWMVIQVRRLKTADEGIHWVSDGAVCISDEMEAHCVAELVGTIPDSYAFLVDLTPDALPHIETYGGLNR